MKLLNTLKPTMVPATNASIVVFYIDGLQGIVEDKITNLAGLCRLSANSVPIIVKGWNLGPTIEVVDVEVIGIVQALEEACKITTPTTIITPTTIKRTFYIFIDS
jgi:hypothetical protein